MVQGRLLGMARDSPTRAGTYQELNLWWGSLWLGGGEFCNLGFTIYIFFKGAPGFARSFFRAPSTPRTSTKAHIHLFL